MCTAGLRRESPKVQVNKRRTAPAEGPPRNSEAPSLRPQPRALPMHTSHAKRPALSPPHTPVLSLTYMQPSSASLLVSLSGLLVPLTGSPHTPKSSPAISSRSLFSPPPFPSLPWEGSSGKNHCRAGKRPVQAPRARQMPLSLPQNRPWKHKCRAYATRVSLPHSGARPPRSWAGSVTN